MKTFLQDYEYAAWVPCVGDLKFSLFNTNTHPVNTISQSKYSSFAVYEPDKTQKKIRDEAKRTYIVGTSFLSLKDVLDKDRDDKFSGEFRYWIIGKEVAKFSDGQAYNCLEASLFVTHTKNSLPVDEEALILKSVEEISVLRKEYNALRVKGGTFDELDENLQKQKQEYDSIETQLRALTQNPIAKPEQKEKFFIRKIDFCLLKNGLLFMKDGEVHSSIRQPEFEKITNHENYRTHRFYKMAYFYIKSCFHEHVFHSASSDALVGCFSLGSFSQAFWKNEDFEKKALKEIYKNQKAFLTKKLSTYLRDTTKRDIAATAGLALYLESLCKQFADIGAFDKDQKAREKEKHEIDIFTKKCELVDKVHGYPSDYSQSLLNIQSYFLWVAPVVFFYVFILNGLKPEIQNPLNLNFLFEDFESVFSEHDTYTIFVKLVSIVVVFGFACVFRNFLLRQLPTNRQNRFTKKLKRLFYKWISGSFPRFSQDRVSIPLKMRLSRFMHRKTQDGIKNRLLFIACVVFIVSIYFVFS